MSKQSALIQLIGDEVLRNQERIGFQETAPSDVDCSDLEDFERVFESLRTQGLVKNALATVTVRSTRPRFLRAILTLEGWKSYYGEDYGSRTPFVELDRLVRWLREHGPVPQLKTSTIVEVTGIPTEDLAAYLMEELAPCLTMKRDPSPAFSGKFIYHGVALRT